MHQRSKSAVNTGKSRRIFRGNEPLVLRWDRGPSLPPYDHEVMISRVNLWVVIHTVWAGRLKITDGSQFVTTKTGPAML